MRILSEWCATGSGGATLPTGSGTAPQLCETICATCWTDCRLLSSQRGATPYVALHALVAGFAADKAIVDESSARAAVTEVTAE